MPCLIALLALISPRLALIALWLLTNLLGRVFDGVLLPVLGFLLLPWTTLAWVLMWDVGTHEVAGLEWFVVILAFVADLASYAGGRD